MVVLTKEKVVQVKVFRKVCIVKRRGSTHHVISRVIMQVIIKRLSRHYSTNWVSKTGLTNKHFKARIFANNQDSSLRQFQVEDGMEWNIEDLEEYGYDDHTSLGHHILDQVREVRRYLRLEKYELPKLAGDFSSLSLSLPFITNEGKE